MTQPTSTFDKLAEPLCESADVKPSFVTTSGGAIPVDGLFGPQTGAALKAFLSAQNVKVAESGSGGGCRACPCHGCCRSHCHMGIRSLDRETIKLLQSFLNEYGSAGIPVDGWWGCRSGKALQHFLNANWTTAGWREAQLREDGRARRKTTKALQTFLNAHVASESAKGMMA